VSTGSAARRSVDLDADTLARRICATAAHNLTPASWKRYFHDQPFPAELPCG
jgi:hypothetical protein